MAEEADIGSLLVGEPGRVSRWAYDLLLKLVAASDGWAAREVGCYFDPQPVPNRKALLLSNFPSPRIGNAMAAGRLNTVLLVTDPDLFITFMQQFDKVSLREAVRFHSAGHVANIAFSRAPHRSFVVPDLAAPARAFVSDLIGRLRIDIAPEAADAAIRALNADPDQPLADAIKARFPRFDAAALAQAAAEHPQSAAIARQVLVPLMALALGRRDQAIVWPREVFLSADAPDTPLPETASIVGPSRNIAYGPYFHLPPATYTAEVVITFRDGAEEIPFVIEVVAERTLARCEMQPPASGRYVCRFQFAHTDPAKAIEMVVRTTKGAIEGEISLDSVMLWVAPDADGNA